MYTRNKPALFFTLIFILLSPIKAQSLESSIVETDRFNDALRALHISGIEEDLANLHKFFIEELVPKIDSSDAISLTTKSDVKAILSESSLESEYTNAIAGYVSNSLSDKDLKIILEWLESPTGLKISDLETSRTAKFDSMTDEEKSSFEGRTEVAKFNERTTEKMKLLESYLEMFAPMGANLLKVSALLEGRKLPVSDEMLLGLVKGQMNLGQEQLKQEVLQLQLFKYHTLSTDELRHYEEFLDTNAARLLYKTSHEAILININKTWKDVLLLLESAQTSNR